LYLYVRIGKNPKQFSTHSFRRGGASWAFSSEIPSELIQLYGDWKSDAYKNYLRFSFGFLPMQLIKFLMED
jgi:hypothetical protein